LNRGGGPPYFLQVAGYWALELRAAKGSLLESEGLTILVHAMHRQVESHFEYFWKHLTPRVQYALAVLPLAQSAETYQEQLETLARLCLIVKESERYRCFSPLFRDFVRRQKVEGVLQADLFALAVPHRRALLRE